MDEDGDEPDLSHMRHLQGVLTGEGGIDEQDQDRPHDELGLGCGRLVCRRCSYEDIPACVRIFLLFVTSIPSISPVVILRRVLNATDRGHNHSQGN